MPEVRELRIPERLADAVEITRVVSTVPTKGRMLLLTDSHCAAYSSSLVSSASWAPTVLGTGSGNGPGVDGAEGVALAELQRTGLLRSTPRGSNSTMSKRAWSWAVSTPNSAGRSLTPDPPGPPGSITRDPIRWAGSVARCMARAIWIVPNWGWS